MWASDVKYKYLTYLMWAHTEWRTSLEISILVTKLRDNWVWAEEVMAKWEESEEENKEENEEGQPREKKAKNFGGKPVLRG